MVDSNTILYRYLSADRFIEMVFSKKLALINPSLWIDSYESYWLRRLKTDEGRKQLTDYVERNSSDPESDANKILALCEKEYDCTYCLCFSSQKDAEVLWSAKADNNKSVMFATTAGKLLGLFPPGTNCTVAQVQYDLKQNTMDEFLGRFHLCPEGVFHFDADELFLHKRDCFSYESELRLIVIEGTAQEGKTIEYPIPDTSKLIDGVMVHPLAKPAHVGLIELICKQLNIPFWGKSTVYDCLLY